MTAMLHAAPPQSASPATPMRLERRHWLAALAALVVFFTPYQTLVMKPGTSALFVLDDDGDMEMILHKIQGLSGTLLKTNVDLERAKLIQSMLVVSSPVEK